MPIIAIAMGGILFSCVDSGKDLYDPSYETSNPMGDGFAAPDGFDWSTIKTENVTVEVKDEEGGLYSYLVEIYTEDPLTNENASVLATRTANKENNFKATAAITLLPTQKGIYIKQTDEQLYCVTLPIKLPLTITVHSNLTDMTVRLKPKFTLMQHGQFRLHSSSRMVLKSLLWTMLK